jgi:hypothetical protein
MGGFGNRRERLLVTQVEIGWLDSSLSIQGTRSREKGSRAVVTRPCA